MAAGGSLAWVVHGELDLLGGFWTDVPFRLTRRDLLFLGVEAQVALEQPSDFTFEMRDLQYRLAAGWRRRPGWAGGRVLEASLGQRGRENVDRSGQPWVRYAAIGAESASFSRRRTATSGSSRFDWRVAAGPVIEEREVEADAVLGGEASFWLAAAGASGAAIALDVDLDALVADGLEADFELGPRLSLPVAGGRRASFYVHYRGAENPLGNDASAWLVGFAYEEGASPDRLARPGIDGRLAAGAGEGRMAGELWLRFEFPTPLTRWYPLVSLDGNILTADDTGDLYFRYTVGGERDGAPIVVMAQFDHRSNHVLAEPNEHITSLNVLEAGLRTPGWHVPAGRSERQLDGYATAGWVVSSTFGEDRRWQLAAGGRWSPLQQSRPRPYVVLEVEEGDVGRRVFATGLAFQRDLELQLEFRDDEQLFAADRTALLLLARYGF